MSITTLGIVLGYKCNLRCKSCLWGDELDNPSLMTVEDAMGYIDQAAELGTIRMVGFTGGEPTIFKKLIRSAMAYAAEKHGIPSAISTNCSWATSQNKADSFLLGFHKLGMRRLQVSIDDFHEEFMPAKRVEYAIRAAMKLDMKTTLVCVVTKSSKKVDDYLAEFELEQSDLLDAFDAPCTPVGFASEFIPRSEFETQPGVPADFCSMLDVLNVLPDGSLQMCCGAPFHVSSLKAGNLKKTSLSALVKTAEWDPVFNSLSINVGPRELANMLIEAGRGEFLKDEYATACEACHDIFSRPGNRSWLENQLDSKRPELFVNNAIVTSIRVENENKEKLSLY